MAELLSLMGCVGFFRGYLATSSVSKKHYLSLTDSKSIADSIKNIVNKIGGSGKSEYRCWRNIYHVYKVKQILLWLLLMKYHTLLWNYPWEWIRY